LIFLAAFGLSAIRQVMLGAVGPATQWSAAMFGGALADFVLPGIVPLIWWGIRRFDRDRATGPVATWAVLTVLMGFFSLQGTWYEVNPPEFMTYPYQPPRCEFVIRFPAPFGDAQVDRITLQLLNEKELITRTAMLRAGCLELDGAPLQDKEALSDFMADLGKQMGLRDAVVKYTVEDGVPVGSATGTKLIDARTARYEYRWYIGDRSALTVTTGSLAKDYPTRDIVRFHDSVERLRPDNAD
jgi:hypothetical protein